MKKLKILFFILALSIFLNAGILGAGAASSVLMESQKELRQIGKTGYDIMGGVPTSPIDIVIKIVNIILGFLGIIFLILMLYAGFLWMTAAGAEDKLNKAKGIIKNSIIGIAIILAAYSITNFVIVNILEAIK